MNFVFHVIHLRKCLVKGDNVFEIGVPINLIQPPLIPHEPLDFQEKCTRHSIHKEYLVKWKDRLEEGSTWERVSSLKSYFPTFLF